MRILRSTFIGSKRAWLPSRRSVLIQIGGALIVRFGFEMLSEPPVRPYYDALGADYFRWLRAIAR